MNQMLLNMNPPTSHIPQWEFFNFIYFLPLYLTIPKILFNQISTDICYNADYNVFCSVTTPSWITLPTEHATQWVTVGKKVGNVIINFYNNSKDIKYKNCNKLNIFIKTIGFYRYFNIAFNQIILCLLLFHNFTWLY